MSRYITTIAPTHIVEAVNEHFTNFNRDYVKGSGMPDGLEMSKLLDSGVFIAGGCFKDIIRRKSSKDLDLFFPSEELYNKTHDTLKTVSKNSNKKIEEEYQSDNSVCYKNSFNRKLDLVFRSFKNVEDTLDGFDFTVTKMALFKKDDEYYIMYHKDFYDHVENMTLHLDDNYITGEHFVVERILRYSKYGYSPTMSTLSRSIEHVVSKYTPHLSHKKIIKEILKVKTSGRFLKRTKEEKILSVIEDVEGNLQKGAEYASNEMSERILSRELEQYALGYDAVINAYEEKVQKYYVAYNQIRRYKLKPTLPMLRFIEHVERQYTAEQTATLLHFLATPVRMVNITTKGETILECCGRVADLPIYSHERVENVYSWDAEETELVECDAKQLNRDNESDILMSLLKKYNIEEVVGILEIVYEQGNVHQFPTYEQWTELIEDGIIKPECNIGLIFDIIQEKTK